MKTTTYKGKSYRVLFDGPTQFGRRAKLQFMDGSKTDLRKRTENEIKVRATLHGVWPTGKSGQGCRRRPIETLGLL